MVVTRNKYCSAMNYNLYLYTRTPSHNKKLGGTKMKNAILSKLAANKMATALCSILCAVLFVSANTNSCLMVHQPQTPAGLQRFSKVR